MKKRIEPKSEAVKNRTVFKDEYYFYDEESKPIHKSRVIYKKKPQIHVYPFNYNELTGLKQKKISEIEFRGWVSYDDIPKLLKPGKYISLTHKKIAPLMRALYSKYPRLEKLIITKGGGISRFSAKTVSLSFQDLQSVCKEIGKEITTFDSRRKIATVNALAQISSSFSPTETKLSKGGLVHFLSHHGDDVSLSTADADALLSLMSHMPMGSVTVTENFIQTKNRINVSYLETVIEKYETLLRVKSDNEKDWQEFFDQHGWILASVFPYQVILNKREAYVGGKTIENSEGRVVDFLFQNGFRDNYALLEIKTHNKKLLKAKAYREPDAFSQHDDCAGAIAQCLDQKNIFLTEMGLKYSLLDPKVVLIIGTKESLTENQARAFELLRSNQKNIDIVTFDEVLGKIRGLRSILQK